MVGETLRRQDTQYCHLHNYDLTFAFYSKFPSWGRRDARGPCSQSAIPRPRLLFAWWQYKVSWIRIKAVDILRNGHFSWVLLWHLSFYCPWFVFCILSSVFFVHLWGCRCWNVSGFRSRSLSRAWMCFSLKLFRRFTNKNQTQHYCFLLFFTIDSFQ